MIEFDRDMLPAATAHTNIVVIGVGGAGNNTINHLVHAGRLLHVRTLAVNTDIQALHLSHAHLNVQIGMKTTRGLGSGAQPEVGKKAAEEDIAKIIEAVEHADVVFLTGGLGGGTGSGALPVIARALKDRNILTIAVVTKPFEFEGKRRMAIAEKAAQALAEEVDTLMVIPNQRLLQLGPKTSSLLESFAVINERIEQFVTSICNIILKPGYMNVDFADVKAVMQHMGSTVMGIGSAQGADRAELAALEAVSSPLLEHIHIEGARGILLNITADETLGLHELETVASLVQAQAHQDAMIIVGSVIDAAAGDTLSVTVIATGFTQPSIPVEQTAPHVAAPSHTNPAGVHTLGAGEPLTSSSPSAHAFNPLPTGAHPAGPGQADMNALEVPTLLRKLVQEKQQLHAKPHQ